VPTPRPQAGEVLVALRAAGLNRADVLVREGKIAAARSRASRTLSPTSPKRRASLLGRATPAPAPGLVDGSAPTRAAAMHAGSDFRRTMPQEFRQKPGAHAARPAGRGPAPRPAPNGRRRPRPLARALRAARRRGRPSGLRRVRQRTAHGRPALPPCRLPCRLQPLVQLPLKTRHRLPPIRNVGQARGVQRVDHQSLPAGLFAVTLSSPPRVVRTSSLSPAWGWLLWTWWAGRGQFEP